MPGSWENLISNILSLYYYNKVQIARLFHNVSQTMLKHIAYTYPFTTRSGPGMPGPPPCRYCDLIFHYCREGACPSVAHCLYCPLLPPGRPCRGGIHAARAPSPYRKPYSPPLRRGRARPARNLSDTTTCGQCAANPQHAPCPKITLKICRKNQKQPLTKVIHIAIIIKLSRGGHAAKSAS